MSKQIQTQGVTIPSQKRYIGYYSDILRFGMPEQPQVILHQIKISCSKYTKHIRAAPVVGILRGRGGTEKSEYYQLVKSFSNRAPQASQDVVVDLHDTPVQGDIKIAIIDRGVDKEKELCHFWFNTGFIDDNRLILQRPQIDQVSFFE